LTEESVRSKRGYDPPKLSSLQTYQDVKALCAQRKAELAIAAAEVLLKVPLHHRKGEQQAIVQLLTVLLRSSSELTLRDCEHLVELYDGAATGAEHLFPLGLLIGQVKQLAERDGLGQALRTRLAALMSRIGSHYPHYPREAATVAELLARAASDGAGIVLDPADPFGAIVNATLAAMPVHVRRHYAALVGHWRTASGSKPSARFLKTVSALVGSIGAGELLSCCSGWLQQVRKIEVRTTTHTTTTYNGQPYSWTTSEYLNPNSYDAYPQVAHEPDPENAGGPARPLGPRAPQRALVGVARLRTALSAAWTHGLKIAKVASIQDKFLVVKGSLRTYKIHIGSGNILMEPNDQYLCIVPDRKAPADADRLFLPFEGDNTLSIVLSKAFLLAEDDKIADPTITRQIR
jgi:hypothetical protein